MFKENESDEWKGITQHDVGILKDIENESDDDSDYGYGCKSLYLKTASFNCSTHIENLHCCIGLHLFLLTIVLIE